MLGAGVFVVWAPAAAAAKGWLLVSLGIAAVVAALNASSTAALASRHPVAGGAYAYGTRELPGPWGYLAGLGFVVGKTASVAAMALAIGSHAWPDHAKVVATVAVVGAWALNAAGVHRTALATTVIACVVAATVTAVAVGVLLAGPGSPGIVWQGDADVLGIVRGAALLFFAFAGYARLATMGEEVRDPRRTIPRAIGAAFVVVAGIYGLVAVALLSSQSWRELAAANAPLIDAVGGRWAAPLAGVAALAAGGAMLALMAGLGRTAMAMARGGDLPHALAHLSSKHVPARTEGILTACSLALLWFVNLGGVIALSSAAVLLFYAVANAAAFAVRRRDASFPVPAALSGLGLALCVALVATLPPAAVITAVALLAAAAGVRAVLRRPAN